MGKMTFQQVEASLQRILIFFFPKADEQALYVQAIHEQVSGLCTPEIFDRACSVVCGQMEGGRKPVPSEYLSAIKGILSLSKKRHNCEKCGGGRMVNGEIWSELYGKRVTSMILCPECSGGEAGVKGAG